MDLDLKKFVAGLHDYLGKAITPLAADVKAMRAEVAGLKASLATLETRGLQYRGTYQRADEYRVGDAVTYAGSLWVASATELRNAGQGQRLAARGQGAPMTDWLDREELERVICAAVVDSPTFAWHSTSIGEDGKLVVLFETADGETWALIGTPQAGAPMTFERVE